MTSRCIIPMATFAEEKFSTDPDDLRQEYFRTITIEAKTYKQYERDTSFNSYLTTK